MSVLSSLFSGAVTTVAPFMKWIKIAIIAVIVGTIVGLYWRASYLSHRIDSLNTQVSTLNEKIDLAKSANDSNLSTIDALQKANTAFAQEHDGDKQKIDLLSSKSADLESSLASSRSELLKLQSKDKLYDTQHILDIDLAAAIPELAQRLRDEQRAIYQDGDEDSRGAGDNKDTGAPAAAMPAFTEASGVWASAYWGQPSCGRGSDADASELQQAYFPDQACIVWQD